MASYYYVSSLAAKESMLSKPEERKIIQLPKQSPLQVTTPMRAHVAAPLFFNQQFADQSYYRPGIAPPACYVAAILKSTLMKLA
jgi:hypothetical protein